MLKNGDHVNWGKKKYGGKDGWSGKSEENRKLWVLRWCNSEWRRVGIRGAQANLTQCKCMETNGMSDERQTDINEAEGHSARCMRDSRMDQKQWRSKKNTYGDLKYVSMIDLTKTLKQGVVWNIFRQTGLAAHMETKKLPLRAIEINCELK